MSKMRCRFPQKWGALFAQKGLGFGGFWVKKGLFLSSIEIIFFLLDALVGESV